MSMFEILHRRHVAHAERATAPAHATVDLAGILRMLRSQWHVVALTLAVFLGAAAAYSMLSPKTWRTSARVLLDPREKQLVGEGVARQMQGSEPGWVETRLELVKSFDTLAAVVKTENLVDDEEVFGTRAKTAAGEDPVAGAVRNLAEMVIVERPKENNLIDVTVTSRSPDKSARLANAVAAAFVDGLATAKVQQIEHANDLLSRQVDEMRAKMLEAEARVEDYKREHGIAMTRGNLVEEETLRQSNEALVTARARMQEARERSERLSKALQSGDAAVLSQTDPIGSAVISRLKIEAAMAERRKSELEQSLGPRHPRVVAAGAEVERARAQILDEVKSLAATAALDYQVARATEENARKALERAQASLADVSQATVGLQELQNEANARRELYKSFVSRMEETTLQRNTQVSDARLVSPAQIPLRPFAPRVSLALALALIAGLGTGLSLAIHRGRHVISGSPAAAAPVPVATAVPVAVSEAPVPAPAPEPTLAPDAPAVIPPAMVAVARDEIPPHDDALPTPTPTPAPVAETEPPESMADLDAADADESIEMAPPARAQAFRRVEFPLSLERIAALGASASSGGGARAFVGGDGRTTAEDLARLGGLAEALGDDGGRGVRVVSSNSLPTLATAALTFGLARAGTIGGRRAALIDLAHDDTALDPIFDAAIPLPSTTTAASEAWERVIDGDLLLLRPLDPVVAGDPDGHPADLAAVVAELRGTAATVVLHLGRQPTAALLFDAAETADHVTLVVDEKDLAMRRVADEIEVVKGLLPRFDGLVVLTHADGAAGAPLDRRPGSARASERA